MTTTLPNDRMMAPWWSHLNAAKADNKIVLREVQNDIAPFKANLKNDGVYRGEVRKLLDTAGLHVTRGARKELTALLDKNPQIYHSPATVMGAAQFHPGQGMARGHGPSVSLTVMFGEGTAKAVTKSWYDRDTLFVQVHGESTMLTRMRTMPHDISVDVARPPSMGTFKLRIVDENGQVIGRGPDLSGVPPPAARG